MFAAHRDESQISPKQHDAFPYINERIPLFCSMHKLCCRAYVQFVWMKNFLLRLQSFLYSSRCTYDISRRACIVHNECIKHIEETTILFLLFHPFKRSIRAAYDLHLDLVTVSRTSGRLPLRCTYFVFTFFLLTKTVFIHRRVCVG